MFGDRRPYFGQDPFVVKSDGSFLVVESQDERRIVIRQFETFETIRHNQVSIIWDDSMEREVWAPELHCISDKWYVYYAASDGDNRNHRMFALESVSPFGPYQSRGQMGPDIWGIDMTVFRHRDGLFCAWSGWENNGDEFPQHLYVAPMYGPYVVGQRVRISTPELPWERSRAPVNEGPQALHDPQGKLFLSYSANASWTQEYCVGLLELIGDDPLDPVAWFKHPTPLLVNGGHGCFVDGMYIYHRKLSGLPGWTDREIQWRPFAWESGKLVLR